MDGTLVWEALNHPSLLNVAGGVGGDIISTIV